MAKRRYSLTIVYDPDTEDLDWLCESVEAEDGGDTLEIPQSELPPEAEIKLRDGIPYCVIDLGDYFDEETMELINECYIIAEA